EVCAIEDRLGRNRKLGVRAVGILDGDVGGDPQPSCGRSATTCESLDRRLRGGCFWVAASSSPENRAAVAQKIREAPNRRVLWVHERQGRILPDNIRICTSSAEESYHHPLR